MKLPESASKEQRDYGKTISHYVDGDEDEGVRRRKESRVKKCNRELVRFVSRLASLAESLEKLIQAIFAIRLVPIAVRTAKR